MRASSRLYIGALAVSLVTGFSALAQDALIKMPKGYQEGRTDAVYGTYFSVVNPEGRGLQNRMLNLEARVMGFSSLSKEDRIQQAEALFTLEHAIFKLQMDIGNAPDSALTTFERESLLFNNTRTYAALRTHGERIFEDMVRYIDVQLPGPNGLQLRTDVGLESTYLPNYRTDAALSADERAKAYKEKLAEFTAKGGSLNEIFKLTPKAVKEMGPYTRVEYIVKENGDILVTPGKAGHILLAAGEKVRAGGQMVFIKNRKGRVVMAVMSNSSGSFKPDMYSVQATADKLAKLTGLSQRSIVLTKGEPISTQAVKVYAKGMGLPKDVTDARVARLNRMEKDLSLGGAVIGHAQCSDIFASL